MYAIVKTGGKQYRVERGQRLLVERLSAAEGEIVTLQPILYRSEEAVFDKTGLAKVEVTAKVIAHERGEKLRVFKFKPKRGYKRRTGHRQDLTRIEVTKIALAGTSPGTSPGTGRAAAKPVAAKPAAKPTTKPTAKQLVAKQAAKPVAAKPAAKPTAKPIAAPEVPKAEGAEAPKAKEEAKKHGS
jgi:large subunit ribosomal protein L21